MTKEHFKHIKKNTRFKHFLSFIYGLLGAGIPLKYIDTNDWENNYIPAVYLHNKSNMFLKRKCIRTSNYDLLNAIKFFNQ